MVYHALEKKSLPKSTKQTGAILGVGLLLLGILRAYPYGFFAGAVLLIAVLFKKEVFIDETGLVSRYSLYKFVHTDRWSFNEIQYIHKELNMRRPDTAALHFTKGAMSRMVLFRVNDCDAVVNLAKKINPDIFYGDV